MLIQNIQSSITIKSHSHSYNSFFPIIEFVTMGTVKSLYSRNQYLYWYIQKGDHSKMTAHIEKYPEIISQPMTKDCKSLPLARAAWRGDVKAINILLDHKADINQVNHQGQTALIVASKRNRMNILKLLVENGADPNVTSDLGLKAMEYALLAGFYDIALYLYSITTDKSLKTVDQYTTIGKKFDYRYANYEIILNGLRDGVDPNDIDNFWTRPKKVYKDPVIDPRETWGQWFKRVADFKPAPLVQRDQLPEELQPQNRAMGKIHHYLDKIASSGSKGPKPQIYPVNSESKSEMADLSQSQIMRKKKAEQVQSEV